LIAALDGSRAHDTRPLSPTKKTKAALNRPDDAAGPIVVTFLAAPGVDLAERRISEQQAADLRWRAATFAEDWQRPEIDVYDAL
jgi:hypothetical protein